MKAASHVTAGTFNEVIQSVSRTKQVSEIKDSVDEKNKRK